MKAIKLPNLPEFSARNYTIAGYVAGALVTLSGLFLIYEVLFNADLTFKANWNMFKSPLGSVCLFIGFIWAMLWWGKFTHWSATPVIETRDSWGNVKKREEDFDVSNQLFGKVLMPILGHFIIEPIIYGAVIYYPLQCIIALVGAIFPYVVALLVLAIIAGAWLFTRYCHFRYHSTALVVLGVLCTVGFTLAAFALKNAEPGSTIQMLVDTGSADTGDADRSEMPIASGEETAVEESDYDPGMAEDYDDQFEGYGEEGLYGTLPNGTTTTFAGTMGGYPIELAITRDDSRGVLKAVYKNVRYGTTMNLTGESLPAMGGDISFLGSTGGSDWDFQLTGTADHITGTAYGDGKELKLDLSQKN